MLGGKKNSRRMMYAISPSLKLLPRLTAPHWGPLELEAREDQLILQLEESHRPSLGSACAETRGRLVLLCDASWDDCYCLRGAGCFRMGQASKPNHRRLSGGSDNSDEMQKNLEMRSPMMARWAGWLIADGARLLISLSDFFLVCSKVASPAPFCLSDPLQSGTGAGSRLQGLQGNFGLARETGRMPYPVLEEVRLHTRSS